MDTITSKTVLLTVACIAGAASVGVVEAQALAPGEATRAEVVRYGDLDTATDRGAALLYSRLSEAARTVCGEDTFDPGLLELWRGIKSCEQDAIARAVVQVDSPKLTSVYGRHYRTAALARTVRATPPTRANEVTVG